MDNRSDRLAAGYGYADTSAHPAGIAAKVIVPLIRKRLAFSSVLDVGCGVGFWLAEFKNCGATEIFGIDGDWVPTHRLVIPQDNFRVHDLTHPVDIGRQFDLVLSLEVAEHIPEACADGFVESLARHGDTVIFSAAIPGQGGFDHVNEQPQDYWIKKFEKLAFTAYDAIRPLIWPDETVPYYYAQNIIVFSRRQLSFPTEFITTPIHPELFRRRTDPRNYSLSVMARHFPHYAARLFKGLLRCR